MKGFFRKAYFDFIHPGILFTVCYEKSQISLIDARGALFG
jgi:hypothetical protein